MIDDIYDNLDNDETVVGIYLDIHKAFGTVDHNILLYKMYNYGVRGVAYRWFVSYLTNRKQFTCIKDVSSSMHDINCVGSTVIPYLY